MANVRLEPRRYWDNDSMMEQRGVLEGLRSTHNRYQREYFDTVERARLALGETRYVLSHLSSMIDELGLDPAQRIVEVGAGQGKFTLPLVVRGFDVVANDLSPVLLQHLRQASGERVRTLCCDVAEIAEATDESFHRAVGFFVLHHLLDFGTVFCSLARILRPGGQVGFCEPVAWNPLYYAQILFTPGMRFAGEASLTSMRPGKILAAMRAAGFVDVRSRSYGYFPPAIKNHPTGDKLEQWLDHQRWVPFPHAFQLFTAKVPG
jgi:ubiquinone/menaquinone biosynthesis C-methylase UbiE